MRTIGPYLLFYLFRFEMEIKIIAQLRYGQTLTGLIRFQRDPIEPKIVGSLLNGSITSNLNYGIEPEHNHSVRFGSIWFYSITIIYISNALIIPTIYFILVMYETIQ